MPGRKMDLIGLDVGFSKTRRSSGVARLSNGELRIGRATSSRESRLEVLGSKGGADIAAIDAPVLPDLHWGARPCEKLLTLGAFQRRCKPYLSHVRGTGQQLRRAGFDTARQIAPLVPVAHNKFDFPRVWPGSNIVEAFPNAYLALVIPVTYFERMPFLQRGRKFDWLYDQWLALDLFSKQALRLERSGTLLRNCRECADHEERAALVCLLTAGSVAQNQYTAIGERKSGYIFLPPFNHWAQWAKSELEKQRTRLEGFEIWVNGRLICNSQSLP